MNKDDKFMLIDATMEIVVGGFGNDAGNIDLAKLDKEQVKQMIIEDNSKEDDIRLVLSLLDTINNQQEKLDKINEICENSDDLYTLEEDYDYEENLTLEPTPSSVLDDIQKIINEGSDE